MNIKRVLNHIRYQPVLSVLSRHAFLPVQRACKFLDEQIRKKVWVNGGAVDYDGIKLNFPRNVGVPFSSSIFWNGADGFEPNTWRVLRHLVEKSRHFIDVGSNIGLYAVLAKLVNSSIIVDAFEPIPSIYRKNVLFHRANGLEVSRLRNAALSDSDGNAALFLPSSDYPSEEASAGTLRPDSWQYREEGRQCIQVQTQRLDTFLQGKEVRTPMVIKIDVEDFEGSVLEGGRETLANLRPAIVCEILPRNHGNQQTLQVLSSLGYSTFAICDAGLFRFEKDDFVRLREFTDFLCVHDSSLARDLNYIPHAGMFDAL